MRFTYNWLKDFVEIRIPPYSLAEKLTMSGIEVTSVEEKEGDFVFEVEVTSNRPDCLSVIGIAREVAAITNTKLRAYSVERRAYRKTKRYTLSLPAGAGEALNAKTFKIEIENKKDCPLYTAKIIKGVKVGSSPAWLRKRLELIGCRTVNNIVDITNYVLFTFGEPLHAFDLDRLTGTSIVVRRAKSGEKITTIDGQQKTLNPDILVIADIQKPVAIAGVMGAKDTEVTESTKNILLEAAAFNPVLVRRARGALALSSESAYRFERGVNLAAVESASLRAQGLIEEYAQGRCALAKRSGQDKAKKKSIDLAAPGVSQTLGINIPAAKIKKILNSLGFKAKAKGKKNFRVQVPSHRPDINLEIDLIEEVARIFGFANIPTTLPLIRPELTIAPAESLLPLIKNILVGEGLNEVITYSLIDKDLLAAFGMYRDTEAIAILNPLSREQEILRPTLMPSLAQCVSYNLNQQQDYVNIFEVARVFTGAGAWPKEELNLGIALAGRKSYLFQQGVVKDEAGLLHLKGILEAIFERLGIKDYNFVRGQALTVYVQQEKIGSLLGLSRDTLDKLDIKNKEVFLLELSLDKLSSHAQLKKKFMPLPKYPAVTRDISFILKEDQPLKEALEAIKKQGESLLNEIRIVDYYQGKQIPRGYRSWTISCLYRSGERTLTDAQVNPLHERACSVLTGKFGAKIR